MKHLKRIIFYFGVTAVVILIAIAMVIQCYAPSFLQSSLSQSLNRNVSFHQLRYVPPWGVALNHFSIDGLIKADQLSGQFHPAVLYSGDVHFNSVHIDRPIITITKSKKVLAIEKNGDEQVSTVVHVKGVKDPVHAIAKKEKRWVIHRLDIDNGQLSILHQREEKDVNILLSDVTIDARKFAYPFDQPSQTLFELTAQVMNKDMPLTESRIQGSGWADIANRNMKGYFEFKEPSGSVGLTADVESKSNDMNIKGDIRVAHLMQAFTQGNDKESSLQNSIFGALSNFGVEIGAKYSFNTKMDDFEIDNISFSGNVAARGVK